MTVPRIDPKNPRRLASVTLMATLVLVLVLALAPATLALFNQNLNGYIRLSGTTSHSDTLNDRSLNQDYTLNWQKRITNYITLRSGLHYYDYGVDQNRGANSWQREFQPNAELVWRHPYFGLGASVQRRDSRSNDHTVDLVSNSGALYFRSQIAKYPYLNLRWQLDQTYSRSQLSDRDTRDWTLNLGTGYDHRNTSVAYNYARRKTENRVALITETDDQHSFQLQHLQNFIHGALKTNTSYNLSYRTQQDFSSAGLVPRSLPVFGGLFADDATGDYGALDTLRSLIDSNIVTPVEPEINLGAIGHNWNLGVDLGYPRELNLLYVFTDRPSGNGLNWRVYTSEDNLLWTSGPTASTTYSAGFSRYEISFSSTNSRYVKVVASGINSVDTALVTEIEPLLVTVNAGLDKLDQLTHLFSVTNSLRLSSKVTSSADFNLRRETDNDFFHGRNETDYSFGTRYLTSSRVTNMFRFQIGFIDNHSPVPDVDKTESFSYNLQVKPLDAADFSFSFQSRHNYIGAVKSQEINNGLLQFYGDLFPRLRTSSEFGLGANNVYQSNQSFRSWTFRQSLDGEVSQSLNAIVSYLHQNTDDLRLNTNQVRNQYSVSANYRLTTNVLLRGSADLTDDGRVRYLTQGYAFSWTVSPRLTISAATDLNDYESDTRTRRYDGQIDYYLTSRSAITFSYSDYNLTSAGGGRIKSLRLGLRAGF